MKHTLIIPAILLCATAAMAQTAVCISYDAAGNRTVRTTSCFTGGGVVERTATIEPTEPSTVRVAPNPTTGPVQLFTTGFPPEAQVTVFGLSGAVQQQATLGSGFIDLSSLSNGTYYLRVQHGEVEKTTAIQIVK